MLEEMEATAVDEGVPLEVELARASFRIRAEQAALTPKDLECSFENFDPNAGGNKTALEVAKAFAKNYNGEGVGLLFYGPVGVGKSHLCAAICKGLLKRGIKVRKVSMPDFLAGNRSAFADTENDLDELLDRLAEFEVLWLDDLTADHIACAYEAKRAAELLYRLLDRAIQHKQALLVTTNHTLTELQAKLTELDGSERIFDRLRELVVPIRMHGASQRGKVRDAKIPDWLKAAAGFNAKPTKGA